ncbi:MAG: hypothetical protein E6H08_16935 [Bacteroidetes bacterium]|nr:MAG: hypothetical protein E6H08_16935 [Bacteroidota bacterium]
MAGISSKALAFGKENKYKFNGIEQNNDFDLNIYEAFYRSLDPQIGRFMQIDPITNYQESQYVSMGNNPVKNMDWLGNYFTWGNATVEETYKKLRLENNSRMEGYMKELEDVVGSKDKKDQKRTEQLTNLINSHAALNGQWDEMEESNIEFHVNSDMPTTPKAAGETSFDVDERRVEIKLGKSDQKLETMAHEFRHGYGFLKGELMGTKQGIDPLSDMMDEVVAFNAGILFTDMSSVNRVADGYFDINWFKSSKMGTGSPYLGLAGREEQLTLNTQSATYIKYNPSDRISNLIKNNINTITGAIDRINGHDTRNGGTSTYYYGHSLENRW